jgi:PAS domain S-box-containing protein
MKPHFMIAKRKRAAQALRASEDRYRRLVDCNVIGFVSSELEGRINEANDAFLQMVGYTRKDLQAGKLDWKILTPPEFRAADIRAIRELQQTGTCAPFEKECIRKDGRRISVMIGCAFMEGSQESAVAFVFDLTQRNRADEALRRSEAYLAEAQRLSHTGSFGWAVSSGEMCWSQETFRIFQCDRRTKPTVELVLRRTHPEDEAFVKQTIERASQDGKDFDFKYRLLMPKGAVKHVRIVGHAESDKSGEHKFVGAVMDITAAKEAEDRIRQNERELRIIIETIPTSVVSTLPDGSVDFASQSWLDYLGCSREEMLGWGWMKITHPEDLDRVLHNWQGALAGGEPLEVEARYRQADGKYRWFLNRAVPLRDGEGNVVKWYATVTDIEDRKQAEQKLQRSEAYLHEAQRLGHMGSLATNVSSGAFIASPEFLRIFGCDPDKEKPTVEMFRERIHPDDFSSFRDAWHKAKSEKTDYDFDYRIILPDGSIRHAHTVAHPVFNDSGDLVEFIGTTMDVTERKRAEEELSASEQVARGQVEALAQSLDVLATAPAPDRFIGQMLGTICRQLNGQSVALWLFDEANESLVLRLVVEGKNLAPSDSQHPFAHDPAVWKENRVVKDLIFTGAPLVFEDIETDPRVSVAVRGYFKRHGTKKSLGVPLLANGKVKGIISVRHGVRPPYRREEIELMQALAHQVMLALRLTELAEKSRRAAILEERNRMARDIHDTLAQGFTGVIVQLEAAEEAIACRRHNQVGEHLRRASGLARKSLSEARRSVHALRPEALEEGSLWSALEGMIKSITVGTALHTSFKVQGKVDKLPPVWQENLLHIGQEALTNTLRYAHAHKFGTRLMYDRKELRLEFTDDGDGFKPQDRHDGLGLAGMRERVEQMGGEIRIASSRGKGTRITVVLPSDGKSML